MDTDEDHRRSQQHTIDAGLLSGALHCVKVYYKSSGGIKISAALLVCFGPGSIPTERTDHFD